MPDTSDDLFEFLEADLKSLRPRGGEAARLEDALPRAFELVSSEWTEVEAGQELARLCDYAALRNAQSTLMAAMLVSPIVLVREILAARALWVAIDEARTRG